MKKIVSILAALVLAVLFAATVWAGERSALLSDQELGEIEAMAQILFPDRQIKMAVSDDINGEYVALDFSADDEFIFQIEVCPIEASATVSDPGTKDSAVLKSGGKIVEGIEDILNRSPQDETVFRKILS